MKRLYCSSFAVDQILEHRSDNSAEVCMLFTKLYIICGYSIVNQCVKSNFTKILNRYNKFSAMI